MEARSQDRTSVDLTVGFGGVARHSCVAVLADSTLVGVCEQERATRQRGAGPDESGIPAAALDLLLFHNGLKRGQIREVVSAEPFSRVESAFRHVSLDHHAAHAAAAFLTSPFARAAVLVCDSSSPETSAWLGDAETVSPLPSPWQGPGLATLYSECAEVMGFDGPGREQHFEALARLAVGVRNDKVSTLFSIGGEGIRLAPTWQSSLAELRRGSPVGPEAQGLAAAVQCQLGEILLAMLADVRQASGAAFLCLGGTLFSNTYFCSVAKRSGLFDRVYVPVEPGDSGLAIGGALSVKKIHAPLGPFLGPAYDPQQIKATLDNCKLRYEWLGEEDILVRTVEALVAGHLVGWFQSSMESGRRALGARSILANPSAPHVLENLNRFLKQRPQWRGYALSGLRSDVAEVFGDSTDAPYMECDFTPLDPGIFHEVLPTRGASIRVQTVDEAAPPRFRRLLQVFGQVTGRSLLVNTSFNGLAEPIVCSPRDAVRVFFGTGLDLLIMDRFVVQK